MYVWLTSYCGLLPCSADPPTYVECVGGAVNLWDDDDDDTNSPENNMGDLTYTPMYAYVYNYRPPPRYSDVTQVTSILAHLFWCAVIQFKADLPSVLFLFVMCPINFRFTRSKVKVTRDNFVKKCFPLIFS